MLRSLLRARSRGHGRGGDGRRLLAGRGAILRTLLPLSYPALIGAGLYTFLLAWNEFLFAVVLIEAWEKRVITMAIYSLMAEFVTDWSMMMAFSVLGQRTAGHRVHLPPALHGARHDGGG